MSARVAQAVGRKQRQRIGRPAGDWNSLIDIPKCWKNRLAWPSSAVPDEGLWAMLETHGLGGIAGHGVVQGGFQTGPLEQSARSRYYTNLLLHERSQRLCRKIVEVSRAQNTGVAVLKGPALTEQAYRDGGLRAYGDVDLFAPSRDEALRLLAGLECSDIVEKDADGWHSRVREPGKIAARHAGVTLELMYPGSPSADPMQALLWNHANSIMGVPQSPADLLDPDPSAHFVFLIAHMVTNHMCSRLIWYWDLVMLAEAQRERLDPDWIARELQSLQLLHAASAVGTVCKRAWDIALPLPAPGPGWNRPFLGYVTQPPVILNRRLDLWRASGLWKACLRVLYGAGFYLLCDPRARATPYAADEYTGARLRHALRSGSSPLKRLTSRTLLRVMEGFAHVFCRVLRLRGAAYNHTKDRQYEIAAKKT